ncbi:MAG: hypothetical protein JXR96_12355 [Deltaproteobacteria bacterium]|nr:hypothetical protein [Deltaproteobacteria bacterium]
MQPSHSQNPGGLLGVQLICAGATVLVASPGLAVVIADSMLREQGRILIPGLMLLADLSLWALMAMLPLMVAALVWRARGRIRQRSGRFKAVYYALSVAIQTVVSAGLMALIFALGLQIFEPSYRGVKQPSPDGSRIAYLYGGGLFCGYTIYVRRPGQLSLEELSHFTTECELCPEEPSLRWRGEEVEVLDPTTGLPVPRRELDFRLF